METISYALHLVFLQYRKLNWKIIQLIHTGYQLHLKSHNSSIKSAIWQAMYILWEPLIMDSKVYLWLQNTYINKLE